MVWALFLSIAAVIYLLAKVNGLKGSIYALQGRLSQAYWDQVNASTRHAAEIERERALTKAAIDELSEYPTPLAISACVEEMDRLEVEDLLAEIDEENFN